MAKNAAKGAGRKGTVAKRDQVFNPKNKRWTKRGANKKFLDQMKSRKYFKGVKKVN